MLHSGCCCSGAGTPEHRNRSNKEVTDAVPEQNAVPVQAAKRK